MYEMDVGMIWGSAMIWRTKCGLKFEKEGNNAFIHDYLSRKRTHTSHKIDGLH